MLAAAAAWEQNGSATAIPRMLTIAGQVVSKLSDPTTITVDEAGPGGVSSLHAVIDDPALAYQVNDGDPVVLWDIVNDRPEFAGWIKGPTRVSVWGLGRQISIEATGVEAALDWILCAAQTFLSGTGAATAIQSLVANAFGVGISLRDACDVGLGPGEGSQAAPLAQLGNAGMGNTQSDVTIAAGTTLREAIKSILDVVKTTYGPPINTPAQAVATVDFYFGLRVWSLQADSAQVPADYATLTVTDTAAGATVAASPQHVTDGSDIYRGVYIAGGNAAGSGFIPDGSGIPGPAAVINDSTILTAAARDLRAAAFLFDHGTKERGEFDLEDTTVSTNVRAGSKVTLTDAQLGVAATYLISALRKTYSQMTVSWHVTYGRLPGSAMRQLRRFTRATIN